MAVKISLFPRQHDFVMSEAAHPACISGRGGGKTVGGLVKVFAYHGQNHGARGVITEPTLGAIKRNLIPPLYDFFGDLEGRIWKLHKSSESWELEFPEWNGVAYLRQSVGTDPLAAANALRGGTNAYFWMDEIQEGYQFDAFMILKPSLRQTKDGVHYPHQGWVSGTPHWRKVWVKQLWVDHINPKTQEPMTPRDYPLFQMRTKDNTALREEDLRQYEELYGAGRLGKQELEGEFIAVEGPAFPDFREDIHVRHLPPDMQWRRKVFGIDFGSASPTALMEVGEDLSGRAWVLREFYKRNVDDMEWVKAFQEWGGHRLICDPSRSKVDLEHLEKSYNINIRSSKAVDRETRYRLMNTRLTIRDGRPNLYITPDCPNLIGELQNLAFATNSWGEPDPSGRWEQGLNDHAYDATCYALSVLDRGTRDRPQNRYQFAGYR